MSILKLLLLKSFSLLGHSLFISPFIIISSSISLEENSLLLGIISDFFSKDLSYLCSFGQLLFSISRELIFLLPFE
jgi:hypothetical protein